MSKKTLLAAGAASLLLTACATATGPTDVTQISDPVQREAAIAALKASAPKPLEGNGGKFMSPFTSDGVTAEWVTKSMKVKASGQIGAAAGQIIGEQVAGNIPFIGGFLGKKAGQSLARSAALNAIGGEEFLKSSSDLSFDNLEDMAAYMYAHHAQHPEYAQIVAATGAIYPEFTNVYLTSRPQPK